MNIFMYLMCFLVSLFGMALAIVLKMNSLKQKAYLANIEFNPCDYFKTDWLSVLASFITIIMMLFFLKDIIRIYPRAEEVLMILFGFVGYGGGELMSRIFGVINKRINNIIDHKTTIADKAMGKEGTPTPIIKQ